MVTKLHIGVGVVFALVAAACGSAGGDSPGGGPTPGVLGVTWRLSNLTLDGQEQPLAGTTPTLQFDEGGAAGGVNGCNNFGGSVAFDGDEIAFGAMFVTEMGCEPARAAVEQAFMTALARIDRWDSRGDTLTLSSSDGTALMAFVAPEPVVDRQLAGSWALDTIGDEITVSSIISGTDPTLAIAGDRLGGSTGCNAITGTVRTDIDGTFSVLSLSADDGVCAGDVMVQEQKVLTILEGATSFEVEGDFLLISTDDDRFLRYTFTAG